MLDDRYRNKLSYYNRNKVSYNTTHPELLIGEMWITNTTLNTGCCVSYNTKRIGLVAYTLCGKIAKGLRPVFVHINEYDDKMKHIISERS